MVMRRWLRRGGREGDAQPTERTGERPPEAGAAPPERAGERTAARPRRARPAAARAGRRVLNALAALVSLVTGLVALLIVLGIALVVLEANRDNAIVDALLEAAEFLVEPLDDVFELERRKTMVAVNWGIAMVLYVIAGRFLVRLLRRY
jgi:hypothetical protein